MSTSDSTNTTDVACRLRQSAHRAWAGVVATVLAGVVAGLLLPAEPARDLLVTTAMSAAIAGLAARAAFRHGQLHVLARLHHDTGQQPR